jgi:bacterioferritin
MKSYLNKIKANENVILTIQEEDLDMASETTEDKLEDIHPIIGMLQTALMGEYQQWDLYTAYVDRLSGTSSIGIAEEFKTHAEEELAHIEVLQRYIVSLGSSPTVKRKPIPDLPPNVQVAYILEMQLAFEQDAVALYQKIIKLLGDDHKALTVDLENILVKEMEHVHDLETLLRDKPEILAGLMFTPKEAGEPTKPQAGYGCNVNCKCKGKCGNQCGCRVKYVDKINNHWSMLALKELTPDLYARWQQGQKMTDAEKAQILEMFNLKSVLRDSRARNRFIESL